MIIKKTSEMQLKIIEKNSSVRRESETMMANVRNKAKLDKKLHFFPLICSTVSLSLVDAQHK